MAQITAARFVYQPYLLTLFSSFWSSRKSTNRGFGCFKDFQCKQERKVHTISEHHRRPTYSEPLDRSYEVTEHPVNLKEHKLHRRPTKLIRETPLVGIRMDDRQLKSSRNPHAPFQDRVFNIAQNLNGRCLYAPESVGRYNNLLHLSKPLTAMRGFLLGCRPKKRHGIHGS